MIAGIKRFARIIHILFTLGKYDVLFHKKISEKSFFLGLFFKIISRKNTEKNRGIRLSKAFIELGPTFIKLGQILSTRSDLVGVETANGLGQLRDRLPPFDEAHVIEILEAQFNKPFDQIFKSFDMVPKAAASIAQVHQAVTFEGKKVAVKILRPNLAKAFARDIDLLQMLANLMMRLFKRFKRLRLDEVLEKFKKTCETEMDFRLEAAAASELKLHLEGLSHYRVPEIYWDYTTEKVLTLQWIDGWAMSDVKALKKAGIDLKQLLNHAAVALFRQIFEHGFFHADPHPGNYIVDKTGVVWVIDFGIMGRLDYQERLYLSEMLLGFLKKDYYRVSKAHFDAGYIPKNQDVMLFMQAARSIGEPIFDKPLSKISLGLLLQQLFSVSEQFQMQVQPQLLLLQKSMLTAEGIGKDLDPDLNMWQIAYPLVEGWIREHQGPEAKLARGLKKALTVFNQLPELVAAQPVPVMPTQKPRKIFIPFLLGALITSAIWSLSLTLLQ